MVNIEGCCGHLKPTSEISPIKLVLKWDVLFVI